MANTEAVAFASGTLTLTGNLSNGDTVVIGGKTYTLQTTLTDVDGNVAVGASAAATIDNLYAAINLSGTAGTQYAASMTENEKVEAYSETDTTLVVRAKIPGSIGNHVPTTETSATASWGAATLASGTGDIGQFIDSLLDNNQLNAEAMYEVKKLTPSAD